MDNEIVKQSIISGLRPIDDTFMQKLVEDVGFCEEILQTILQMPDLIVLEVTPQRSLHNIDSRSVTVDVLCENSQGEQFSIEVQKSDNDDHQRRVRYNGACVQTIKFPKNTSFNELFNLYMVYISDFDVFGKGKTIYHIDRVLREIGDVVDNGYYEVYVNTQIDDGTDIAELMSILKSSSVPENKKFPKICNAIKYFKEGKGRNNMCALVEDYAKECVKEKIKASAVKMIQKGMSDEDIHEILELPMEEIVSLRSNV